MRMVLCSWLLDWIEIARGRRPGIAGMFCDTHPAGSLFINGTSCKALGGSSIYDGHNYIDLDSERGQALYHALCVEE